MEHKKRVGPGFGKRNWIDEELSGAYFRDVRLGNRLRTLMGLMSRGLGQTIPMACQDWANTKAAYRFFSNDRVSEEEILSGHFDSTRRRAAAAGQRLLVLHDTTEFSFQSEAGDAPGRSPFLSRRKRTARSILMHSSLVLTEEGIPLGLGAIKFWTREKFKGADALKREKAPARLPAGEKESCRWMENLGQSTALLGRPGDCIHIGDREGDIYELFATAEALGTRFLVRANVDRMAGEGDETMAQVMKRAEVKCLYEVEVRNEDGGPGKALLEVKYERIRVHPPERRMEDCPELMAHVIHAREAEVPRERKRMEWKLITNLAVESPEEAVEKLQWYAMRWNIETFHKILKSGCRVEQSKLETAERLTRLISVFCVLGWRVFWMTGVCRIDPESPPGAALTPEEIKLVDRLLGRARPGGTVKDYLVKIARLGGYLARASDPPPGNTVM